MERSYFQRLLRVVAVLTTYSLLLASILEPLPAISDDESPLRKMWKAFQCSSYALYAEQPKEAQRLFDAGIKAGREALKAGNISQENLLANELPSRALKPTNPSADFFLGRMYSTARERVLVELEEDDQDQVIQRSEQAYRLNNCEVID